jgi:hypothetical protein
VFFVGNCIGTFQTGLFMLTRLLTVIATVLAFPGLSYALQKNYMEWGWTLFRTKVIKAVVCVNL